MASRSVATAIVVAVCLVPFGSLAQQGPPASAPPAAPQVDVTVHRTLVPLFLRAPDGEPATGLALAPEDLKVTLAGKRIAASSDDGYSVDVSCGDAETAVSRPDSTPRRIIVVADLNFVDAAARFRIADALDDLAGGNAGDTAVYSVLAISNRVVPLTPGFVPAGRQLGRAATALRALSFAPDGPARGATSAWTSPLDRSYRAHFGRVFLEAAARWLSKACAQPMLPEQIQAMLYGVPVLGQEIDPRPEPPGRNVSEGIAPEGTLLQREASGFLGGMSTGHGPVMGSQLAPTGFLNDLAAPDHVGDVIVGHDIGRSVQALLAVVRAYAALPAPKWLVLFSGEAFRSSRDNKNDAAVVALTEAAARRFTVWTVDASGISRRQSGASELLAAFAMDSGGAVIRGTNDLSTVFHRVERSSSCYALLGLPPTAVAEHRAVPLEVAIDTQRRPELWGYRIAAPRVVRSVAREREIDTAVAEARGSEGALSSISLGGGFLWPEATAGGTSLGLHVVVDPPAAASGDGYLVDLVATIEYESVGGVRSLPCGVVGGNGSNRLRVRGPRPLVAAYDCGFHGSGRYRATVTAVDPDAGRVGVRTFVLVVPGGEGDPVVRVPYAALLARRDDAVTWHASSSAPVEGAAGQPVFSPSDGEVSAGCASEVAFVVCGEPAAGWPERTTVALVRWDDRQAAGEMAGIVPSSRLVHAPAAGAAGCVAVRAAIAPYSLVPGDYAWLAEVDGATDSEPSTLLSAGVFTVR